MQKEYKHIKQEPYHFTDTELDRIMSNATDEFRPFYQFMLYTGIRCTDLWDMGRDVFYEEQGQLFIKFKMNKTGLLLNVPVCDKARELVESIQSPHYLFPNAMNRGWRESQIWNLKSNFDAKHYQANHIKNHTFRHTFAMHQLYKNTPIKVIQQLLGHTSVTQTEVYANKLPKTHLVDYLK